MKPPSRAALGPRWQLTRTADGGVDLRIAPEGRGRVIAVAIAIAALWSGATLFDFIEQRALPLGASAPAAFGIGVVLVLAALWIALGTERWHFAPNCLEHRVGIGGWQHVRRFRDAELAVTVRANRWGRFYSRLCVMAGSRQHFLFDRKPQELNALAELIGAETGWRRRPDVILGRKAWICAAERRPLELGGASFEAASVNPVFVRPSCCRAREYLCDANVSPW